MDTLLITQIKKRLFEKGLSVRAAERLAGLGVHSLSNVLSGRSKKPSAELLTSVARVLGCSVNELLYDNETSQTINSLPPAPKLELLKNTALFHEIMEFLVKNHWEKVAPLPFHVVVSKSLEIYEYSVSKNNGVFSQTFAEWIIEK